MPAAGHHLDMKREAEELILARLAYLEAGKRPLGEPRRASGQPPVETAAEPEGMAPARPRWRHVNMRHVAVLALLILCGIGVTVAALGRSAATEVPVTPVARVPAVAPSPTASPPSAPARVHVAGAVKKPGVVSVPAGSIVLDAIAAAGGLRKEADPALLNLAAPVSDGMQILVGTVGSPAGEVVAGEPVTGTAAGGGGLDLNRATPAELEELPGVGPVTAAAIVAWRDENGAFTAVEDLQDVTGIGPKTFEKLKDLVRV